MPIRVLTIKPILLMLLVISFFGISCSRKIYFQPSVIVPAANASVKIKSDRNKNYLIDLTVMHLAPANQLTPPKEHYVVWIVTSANAVRNIGQLKSKSGLFSKALKGSLKTNSPFEPTRIFITAEDEQEIASPRGQVVLSTSNFK